jgi:hypothetical protein
MCESIQVEGETEYEENGNMGAYCQTHVSLLSRPNQLMPDIRVGVRQAAED